MLWGRGPTLILLYVDVQLSQHHLLKRLFCIKLSYLPFQVSVDHRCKGVFLCSQLCLWSMYLPNCYFCLLGSLEPVWNLWQVSGAPKGRRCGLRFLWLPVPVLSGFFLAVHMCVLVAQSCRTVCGPMDYSPPGSSVHGILQTRILEWVAMPSSKGSSSHRGRTCIS